MEPIDFARLLVRRIPAVIVVGLAGAALALAFALVQRPEYEAVARVFVSPRTATSLQDVNSGGDFTRQIVKSYAEVATSPLVLRPVISQLGLDESPQQLAKRVTATAALDTVVIDIAADDPDPAQARRIADAVSAGLSTAVDELTTVRTDAAAVSITRIQAATLSPGTSGPSAKVLVPVGALLGLLLGAVGVLLLEAGRRRIHSVRDAGRAGGVPVLIGLPRSRRAAASTPVVVGRPGADGYRALRANLVAGSRAPAGLVVAAPHAGSGATTVAANLAIAFAEGGARVALIEADLRRPSLSHFLQLAPEAGLGDVLGDGAPLDRALLPWGDAGLQVLAAGAVPVNASDLLQGPRMAAVMRDLAARFDLVVYDASPLLDSSDAAVLAGRCDGVVVVVAAEKTSAPQLASALETLTGLRAAALGTVVTGLPRSGPDAPTVLT